MGAASLLLTLLVVYTAEIHPYLDVRTVEAGAIMASLAAGLAFLARAVKLSSTTGSVDRSGATFYSSWCALSVGLFDRLMYTIDQKWNDNIIIDLVV